MIGRVAQASSLWGKRASCLLFLAFKAGKMPACPTAKMAVLRMGSRFQQCNA